MKPLLKLLSQAHAEDTWPVDTLKSAVSVLFEILKYAEDNGIVIWTTVFYSEKMVDGKLKYVSEPLRFTKSFRSYFDQEYKIVHNERWCHFGFPVHDDFIFEYPGDLVADGQLKSKVTKGRGIFTSMGATFEAGVSAELIEKFKKQKGIISSKTDKNTCLHITAEGPPLLVGEPGKKPIFTINQDTFKNLFPKEKKKTINSNLPKGTYGKIKKLLLSNDQAQVESGISLIATLNDPELYDLLLEGVASTKNELTPGKLFIGKTSKSKSSLNASFLRVLGLASQLPAYSAIVERLESLSISVATVGDLHFFKNLKELSIFDVGKINEPLVLPSVEVLQFYGQDNETDYCLFIDFQAIESCSALKELEFDCPMIITGGMKCLGKLKNLKKLILCTVYGMPETNFSWISNCSSLQEFAIYQNRIYGLPGSNEPKNRIDSLRGLENLKELRVLTISGYGFTDFSIAGSLPALKSLTVNYNSALSTFTPPESEVLIRQLDLEECAALSVIAPGNYDSTLSLNISYCGIKEIPVLNGVKTLSSFKLNDCKQLENLDGLKNIIEIERRALYLNGCFSLESLNGIKNLQNLEINGLETKVIPIIDTPNGIISLDLNGPETLERLDQYSGLKSLRIKDGKMTDLKALRSLSNLEILDLSGNQNLISIAGIQELHKLRVLNLMNTVNLEDISIYFDTAVHRKLDVIYIRGSKKKRWNFPSHIQYVIDMESGESGIPVENIV